jgi:hypothetical protein
MNSQSHALASGPCSQCACVGSVSCVPNVFLMCSYSFSWAWHWVCSFLVALCGLQASFQKSAYSRSLVPYSRSLLTLVPFWCPCAVCRTLRTPARRPPPAVAVGFYFVEPGLFCPYSRSLCPIVGSLLTLGCWFLLCWARQARKSPHIVGLFCP